MSDGRCQCTTSMGLQCKRKAVAGTRFCGQHQLCGSVYVSKMEAPVEAKKSGGLFGMLDWFRRPKAEKVNAEAEEVVMPPLEPDDSLPFKKEKPVPRFMQASDLPICVAKNFPYDPSNFLTEKEARMLAQEHNVNVTCANKQVICDKLTARNLATANHKVIAAARRSARYKGTRRSHRRSRRGVSK